MYGVFSVVEEMEAMVASKAVVERKRRLRDAYGRFRRNGESYPTYLEERLEWAEQHRMELVGMVFRQEGRINCCAQYIYDMEKGMRIVESSVSTLKTVRDGEVVIQAVKWLQGIVRDAKERFERGVRDESKHVLP